MRRVVIALVLSAIALSATAAPFQNGSFENATVDPGATFVTLPVGNTQIDGWIVIDGDIDYIGGYWQASNGGRSLDLVGDQNLGGVQQTFDTITGGTYRVSFDIAGNTGGPPTIKPLEVIVGNVDLHFTFDTTGHSTTDMGWESHSFKFVAQGPSSTISFISDTTGLGCCYGAALDNVVIQFEAPQALGQQPVPLDWAGWLAALLISAAALFTLRTRMRRRNFPARR